MPAQVYVFDGEQLAGGLVGQAWLHWLHGELLWADEQLAGSGRCFRLMAAAEEQAGEEHGSSPGTGGTRRDVRRPGPGCYTKQGHTLAGTVPDRPPGRTDHLFVKRL